MEHSKTAPQPFEELAPNPSVQAALEHADPKDRIASMVGHEAGVVRRLGEIEALVNEVEA